MEISPQNLSAPRRGGAAAACRTLAPSSSPGIPLLPPALRCARRPRGGCPRPASLLARPQPACTQRSKLPAPPVLRRRRAVSGRKSGDRRQGSTWRRAAPVWGSTRAAGPRRGVVCAANHEEGKIRVGDRRLFELRDASRPPTSRFSLAHRVRCKVHVVNSWQSSRAHPDGHAVGTVHGMEC